MLDKVSVRVQGKLAALVQKAGTDMHVSVILPDTSPDHGVKSDGWPPIGVRQRGEQYESGIQGCTSSQCSKTPEHGAFSVAVPEPVRVPCPKGIRSNHDELVVHRR